jgi:hypothetical protein
MNFREFWHQENPYSVTSTRRGTTRGVQRSATRRVTSHTYQLLRACLAGLRLCQTNSGVAAPPICSSIVELDSQFGAKEMCLAEITAPAPETEIML